MSRKHESLIRSKKLRYFFLVVSFFLMVGMMFGQVASGLSLMLSNDDMGSSTSEVTAIDTERGFTLTRTTSNGKIVTISAVNYTVLNQTIIQNDADFQNLATKYGWPGNGTATNPYIIENFEIIGNSFYPDQTGLLTINNTRSYFIVRNCVLRDFQNYRVSGILIQNASNGQLYNCEIYNINGTYGVGVRIVNSSFIDIQNLNAHDNNEAGIDIQSYSHFINVENSSFYRNSIGIQVGGYSRDITINANNVFDNFPNGYGGFGLGLYTVTTITVSNNTIWNNAESGIFMDNVNSSVLVNNEIYLNSLSTISSGAAGVEFRYSYGDTLRDNYIYNNSGGGVSILSSSYTSIISNVIHSNNASGILISRGNNYAYNPPSTWNVISDNVISAHPSFGLEIYESLNGTITRNNFVQNAIGQQSQYYDDTYPYDPTTNITYNYWDDWTTPDADLDGIVDVPYTGMDYAGLNPNLQDPYPVTTPYNISILDHFLLPPHVIHPDPGMTVNGTIFIEWRPSFDSWYHAIYYDVYISSDGGYSWSLVASNLTEHSYLIDTTAFANGYSYQVQVVAHGVGGLRSVGYSGIFGIDNTGSHSLTVPVISYPSVGDVVSGVVDIQWNVSIDSLGHSVQYRLFYSDDWGMNWYLLGDNLTSTTFSWDTTTVPDGSLYMLMLEAYDNQGLSVTYMMPGTFTVDNSGIQQHDLSAPAFLFPIGGEILNGTVVVSWNASFDSLGHQVYYDLYYSADNGVIWEFLAGGLIDTTFSWDTTMVSDGDTYLLMVIASDGYGLNASAITPSSFSIRNNQVPPGPSTHTLSDPVILYPQGGDVLSGVVTVQWTSSNDSLGHVVYYSLYYSDDSGQTWVPLILNTTSLTFTWDTTTVPDGNSYVLRIFATDYQGLQAESFSDLFAIDNSVTPPPTSTTSADNATTSAAANDTTTSGNTTIPSAPSLVTPSFSASVFVVSVLSLVLLVNIARKRRY